MKCTLIFSNIQRSWTKSLTNLLQDALIQSREHIFIFYWCRLVDILANTSK